MEVFSQMKSVLFDNLISLAAAIALATALPASAVDAGLAPPSADWLVNPSSFKAQVSIDPSNNQLVLDNGLLRRTLRLAPNAATVDYLNRVTGEQLLRAVGPEARVTLNGTTYAIGGLTGQPTLNFLKPEWLDGLQADPAAYRFVEWKDVPMAPRLEWKKRPAWLAKDLPWPPPGKQVTLRFLAPPLAADPPRPALPEIHLHYAIYDGIPLMEKWLTFHNLSNTPVRINNTVVETLKIAENESSTEENPRWESPNLYVETDYACMNMTGKGANQHAVHFGLDPDYHTQVNYEEKTPALLEVAPEFGPDTDLAPNKSFTSIRAFELMLDSSERERRGLAQRRMYRIIAPWTQENPVMIHLVSSDPGTIRTIIDQAAEVGVEMIILSFGSGLNMENPDPKYQASYKELSDYAATKGVVLGAYSLLASRGATTAADNCRGPGNRVRYGVMPCLGAKWGQDYLTQLKSFITQTGFAILEHDGSYPGDTCAATDHPLHHGLEDSQWVQFQAIADFYKWCRANGIYLNIPDWYFLNGGSKCGMNYKETNWSLPRADQEIIERQNIYDGTWEKTPSMGWMMVPLTQYHGGGAAATIEPLKDHLPHYETRLANLFGAGVQACYRGPRIYDTDDTKALVKKWITFYKSHREVLDADLIHLRRPDGRDWDGFVHVNPQGNEKALAMFYNPLTTEITRTIRLPLRYAGLTGKTLVSVNGSTPTTVPLDPADDLTIKVVIPAGGRTWVLFTAAD